MCFSVCARWEGVLTNTYIEELHSVDICTCKKRILPVSSQYLMSH